MLAKAQINSILINKKCINTALNCEAYSSLERASSVQRIVIAKIRLGLGRNTIQTAKSIHWD